MSVLSIDTSRSESNLSLYACSLALFSSKPRDRLFLACSSRALFSSLELPFLNDSCKERIPDSIPPNIAGLASYTDALAPATKLSFALAAAPVTFPPMYPPNLCRFDAIYFYSLVNVFVTLISCSVLLFDRSLFSHVQSKGLCISPFQMASYCPIPSNYIYDVASLQSLIYNNSKGCRETSLSEKICHSLQHRCFIFPTLGTCPFNFFFQFRHTAEKARNFFKLFL